jgi:hypothetical protein
MERYLSMHREMQEYAAFVKDYASGGWIPASEAVIVKTGVRTPMGSGKLAFADSGTALEFQRRHPQEQE